MKKLIYFYLSLLILVYLFLPLGAKAALPSYLGSYTKAFGQVSLDRTTPTQIELNHEYLLSLDVAEHDASGFYYDNITSIELYKIENNSNNPIRITSVSAYSSPSDAKAQFDNARAVIVSNPQVTNVQLYALVSYTDNAGQPTRFPTNPITYTVIGAVNNPQANQGAGNDTVLGQPTNNAIDTTNTTNTNRQANAANSGGGVSNLILGPACTKDGVVACYANKTIRLFMWIAMVGSVFMIMYGGILLITSAGDTKKVTTGRMAVTGAIIGLVIVLLSYSIQQFIQKTILGDIPGSNTNENVQLDEATKANSLTNTAQIAGGVDFSIIYTRASYGTATSAVNDNGAACNTVTIEGTTINCLIIREGIRDYYPDANWWGEIDSNSGGRTYYLKGINLAPDGKLEVYYKKTSDSAQIYFDSWTAALSAPIAPAAPAGGTQPTGGGTAGGTAGDGGGTGTGVQRVLCIYLGSGNYRQYIYACYENWDKARSKLNELDSFLEAQGRLNNPCDPVTSEFNAAELMSNNPGVYCSGDSSNCPAEIQGGLLMANICLT